MPRVHPTAVVAPGARIADDVQIGPFCVVGANVTLEAGCVLDAHVVVDGHTTVGRNNRFHAFCMIGGAPQDKKYRDEPTRLVLGDDNVVREHCTLHRGTIQGRAQTTIGSNNLIMASVHVAHDCVVGDHVIMANNATLAGHVTVGDHVILGGLVGVHQFCSVGAHAMAGGGSIVLRDIPPFVICNGNPATPHGINSAGLRRRGFDADALMQLRRAYKLLYRSHYTVAEAVAALGQLAAEQLPSAPAVEQLRDFVRDSRRGIIR